METFIYTLIMAIISGITFIAYKHPKGYEKIFNFLYFLNFFVYSIVMAWSISVSYLWGKVVKHITEEQSSVIKPIFDNADVSMLEVNLIFFGVMIYLLFLSYLPHLLEKHDD